MKGGFPTLDDIMKDSTGFKAGEISITRFNRVHKFYPSKLSMVVIDSLAALTPGGRRRNGK